MEALTEIDQSRDLERKRNLDIYEDLRQRQEEGDETVSPDDVAKQRRLAEDVSGDAYAEERKKELQDALGLLNELEPKRLLEDREYRGLQRLSDVLHSKMGGEFNDLYHAGMGATAVQRLLEVIDLEAESRTLKSRCRKRRRAPNVAASSSV